MMGSHLLRLLLGTDYSLRASPDAQEDDSLSSVFVGAIVYVFLIGQVIRQIGRLIERT